MQSIAQDENGRNCKTDCSNQNERAHDELGKQKVVDSSCIRAENEDDDGYDPYSDRRYVEPMFERDPWN